MNSTRFKASVSFVNVHRFINKLRDKSTTPAKSKQEFFLTLVTTVITTGTRRSIIDTAGVLDTPLELVTIKSLKMKGAFFPGTFFSGGLFSREHFSGHPFNFRFKFKVNSLL